MIDHDKHVPARTLRRREVMLGFGGVSAAAIWRATTGSSAVALANTSHASAGIGCILTPEVTEGPFWIPNHLTRRNITDHRPGLPLALHITVVHANKCTAMRNADVEVWQADATGTYSGYSGNVIPGPGGSHANPNNGKRFLRGHQKSDADGRVLFHTIYPGWYSGRTPHIHVKVHLGGSVVHTGQFFFADPVSDAIYRTGAYKRRGQPTTTNRTDAYYAQAGGGRAQLHLTKLPGHTGYGGRITVGVVT